MICTSAEIGDILSGKLSEKRFPIDQPPVWGDGDIVRLQRKNESDRRPKGTSVYVKVTAWDVVDTQNGEEYALWFHPSPAPHTTRGLTYSARPKGSEKGYTNVPGYMMKGEPEALTEVEQEELTKFRQSKYYHYRVKLAREAKEARKSLPIQERIEKAIAAARENNVDVRSNVRTVRRLVNRGKPIGVILQNLVVLERRAYREPE